MNTQGEIDGGKRYKVCPPGMRKSKRHPSRCVHSKSKRLYRRHRRISMSPRRHRRMRGGDDEMEGGEEFLGGEVQFNDSLLAGGHIAGGQIAGGQIAGGQIAAGQAPEFAPQDFIAGGQTVDSLSGGASDLDGGKRYKVCPPGMRKSKRHPSRCVHSKSRRVYKRHRRISMSPRRHRRRS